MIEKICKSCGQVFGQSLDALKHKQGLPYVELDGLFRFWGKVRKKIIYFVLDSFPKYRIPLFMTMIRKTIIERMNELNLNANQLSEKLKGKIPRQTIYDFLTGTSDARTEVASELMRVLGLELVKKHKQKRQAQK
jgi:hypothetical protein